MASARLAQPGAVPGGTAQAQVQRAPAAPRAQAQAHGAQLLKLHGRNKVVGLGAVWRMRPHERGGLPPLTKRPWVDVYDGFHPVNALRNLALDQVQVTCAAAVRILCAATVSDKCACLCI